MGRKEISRAFIVVAFAFMLVSLVTPAVRASPGETILIVEPGATHTLENGFFEYEGILVDGGTLVINNSTVALVPLWHGACNITVRRSGTIKVSNSTIRSNTDYQWFFWVTEDSNVYFDFAEIYDLVVVEEGPPGFMLSFGSSLYVANSSIYGGLFAGFSSSVTMEDSMVGAVILMDNSQGYFDEVEMGELMLQNSEATVENSIVLYPDTIMAVMFSNINILNTCTDSLIVQYNSTATVTDSVIAHSLYVFDGSSVTAYNLTMGFGLYYGVSVHIGAFSGGDFTNLTMIGHDVFIGVKDMSSATFDLLNCTGYNVDINAWKDVSLAITNAVINATRYHYYHEWWDPPHIPELPEHEEYEGDWFHEIGEGAWGGNLGLNFGDKAVVSLANVDVVEAQYVYIQGSHWAELTVRDLSANVTGGRYFHNRTSGHNWPILPGFGYISSIEVLDSYVGGEFHMGIDGEASIDLVGLFVEADDIGIYSHRGVEASLENLHFLSREGHYSYEYYAEGDKFGIHHLYNHTWWRLGRFDMHFGEEVTVNITNLHAEAERIDVHGDNGITATFEDVYLLTRTMGHFDWNYGEWIDASFTHVENSTWYQPSYVDFGFHYGVHVDVVNVTINAHDEYRLSFSEGGNATLTDCNFISQMAESLNYTSYYHSWDGLEEKEYELYEPSSGVWVGHGFGATMVNSTFTSHYGYTNFGSGAWATVTNSSFIHLGHGYFVAYEGVTLTMKNVNINSTHGGFYIGDGCSVTLEGISVVSSHAYEFGIHGSSVIRFINCNIELNMTQGGFWAYGGVTITVENSVIKASWMYIAGAVYGYLSDSELYTPVIINMSSDVTMENCLLNSTLMSGSMSGGSHTTLIDCTVIGNVTAVMGGSLTIDNTALTETLYVMLGPTITVKDSTVIIKTLPPPLPPELEQIPPRFLHSIYWLNAYNAQITLNGTVTDMWVYNLHNHYNASTIYTLGTVNILQIRWCLSVYVVDDYGTPIPSTLVEIRNSTDHLIYSGYTDLNGTVRIFPGNDVYTITVYADDKTATGTATINDMCAEASFELDITKPVIGPITQDLTTPNYTEDVTVTVEVSDPSGIASVTLWYDGNSILMIPVSGDLYSATIPARTYSATVRYYIVAVDNSGNSISSSEYTYTVGDDIPPTGEITTPSTDDCVRGTIDITVTGDDIYFKVMKLYLDGDFKQEWNVGGSQTYAWDTTTYKDGTHTIKLIVYDEAENSIEKIVTVTVDNTLPSGSIDAPTAASYLKGTVAIEVTGSDANFERMELYISGELAKTWTDSGTQTYDWSTTTYTDGLCTIKLIVYDKAGNSVENTLWVIVDNTEPIVSIISPKSVVAGEVTVHFSVFDANLLGVTYAINGGAPVDITGETSFTIDTTTLIEGTHAIAVTATDKAGNSVTETLSLVVDNTTPTVSITSPAEGAELTETVTIEFTATDTNLATVLLYIDNAEFDVTGTTSYEWDTTTVGDGDHTIKIVATDEAGNIEETQITVTTTNVMGTYVSGRNLGLVLGAALFTFIGAAIAFAIMRKRPKI